jgi:5'-deoxynucleotidase
MMNGGCLVYHFFAYLSRMKLIERWGLMHKTKNENIQEHSLQVAYIAHAIGMIKNTYYGGRINSEYIMAIAMYHEISEVITGDLATPIKYFNPKIKDSFQEIEAYAKQKLLGMLPIELAKQYEKYILEENLDEESRKIIKAADKISAYLKCVEELKSGNKEFAQAEEKLKLEISKYGQEVRHFMEVFVPSFSLSLDELE